MELKISHIILVLIVGFLIFVSVTKIHKADMTYVKSDIDGQMYLVRDSKDKKKAANLLASVKTDLLNLTNYMHSNISNNAFKPYAEYISQLKNNMKNVEIRESSHNTVYTSYTVNKGESIVFCIRSKDMNFNSVNTTTSNIHPKNLVMYVALHEISHVACPEYGHTKLFEKIFKFIAENAININIYSKIDFNSSPKEYCGMQITSSVV